MTTSTEQANQTLPWDERITVLSIHPDAASRDDIARMAAELMECRAAAEGQSAQSKAFWGVWSQAIEVVSAQSAAWDEAGKKHFYSGVADEIVALLKKEGRLRALTTASPVTAPHEPHDEFRPPCDIHGYDAPCPICTYLVELNRNPQVSEAG